jgi:hypothetical protein
MVKFLQWGVVNVLPIHQAGGSPLVRCPRLFIQYIRSYPPYLEAVSPSATWERAMPWWQKPTYHRDRDPLITVTGTHLLLWQGPTYQWDRDPLIIVIGIHLSLWQGPTYQWDRDPLINETGTHLSPWQGPTYHCDRDPSINETGTHLSSWPGPTYHCDRDPLITVTGTHFIALLFISNILWSNTRDHLIVPWRQADWW